MATEIDANPRLPGILRLPPDFRRGIYLRLGLGPWQCFGKTEPHVYSLNSHHDYKSDRWPSEPYYNTDYWGMMASCKALYAEASALLYSSNWFVFHYQPAQSLAPLRALTAGTVASLTNLKVVLNQCSCHSWTWGSRSGGDPGCCDRLSSWGLYLQRDDCGEGCREYHKGRHDQPLRGSDPSAQAILAEWQETAAHLGSHLRPGQLELSLVCDVDEGDVGLAKMAVDALEHLPQLKECHIRLSRKPNSKFGTLAREAVLKARGILPRQDRSPSLATSSFRLLDLPPELRHHILNFTDLVTPLKEVMWTRAHGKYLASERYCPGWEGRGDHDWDPRMHHGCQFHNCSDRMWPEVSIGCFCRKQHAAFSSTCRCWAAPTSLFLVCRILREEANQIFFSKNRFVVIDGPGLGVFGPPRSFDYGHSGLAASQFLRHVVPAGCHAHLRLLELVFPPWQPGSWPQDELHPTYRDWADTIDWVKGKINAPALALCMTALFASDEGYTGDPMELTDFEANEVLAVYFRLLKPLACLGGKDGLARFSAQLSWPWTRLRSVLRGRYEEREQVYMEIQSNERSLKGQAESLVLGDKYDFRYLEAAEREPGAWQDIFRRDY